MGRMKEQMGEATIGDLRRDNAIGIIVTCPRPCNHVAAVRFLALGLPDETPFAEIATRKRLRCKECDRIAKPVGISVDYGPASSWGMAPPG